VPDWNTRLAVYLDENTLVTPIDSFSPSFSLNAEALHSIEQTHIGVVYTPQSITFSMTVRAIGEPVGKLTALALAGTRFKIGLQLKIESIVLNDCIITSASPSPATISGAPAATFSGMSLDATVKDKAGTEVSIP
jgi:hypothetical protein